MKKTFKIIVVTAMTCVLAFSTALFSCKKVTDGIRVKVNTNIFTSPIAVRFINLNTTSTTAIGDFAVSITGKNSSVVYTSDGSTTFKAYSGFLSLALDKTAAPSPQNPVNFTITANVNGFAPIVYSVSITSDSAASIVIPVVEYANLPNNTAGVSTQVAVNGTAPSTTIIPTTNGTLAHPATISIDSGTTFFDANNNQLTGSGLNATVVEFGTDDPASTQSIPGGLSSTNVIGADGNPVAGGVNFIPAGSLSIKMDIGGTTIKRFGTPLHVSMPLSANLVNFATGNAIAPNDKIPVYSMDETTGQYRYEALASVVQIGGLMVAKFDVTHLSTWNLSWTGASCTSPLTLTINTSDAKYDGGNYRIQMNDTKGNVIGSPIYTSLHDGMTFTINNVPSGTDLIISVYDKTGALIAASSSFAGCTTSAVAVNVPVNTSNSINVVTNFIGYCTNKNITANLTGTINFQGKSAYDYGSVAVTNGITSFTIDKSSTYTLSCIYNSQSYSTTITFDPNNFTFPANSGITGTASYDANTNTLTLSGQINISNCK